ncbi:MAG: glycosyl transferase family protein [Pseudomonadota bacterium]
MHPFAPIIQILGKGRHGSRSLTQDEARTAMSMILDGQATPEQIGAFLMLIRIREETSEEAAGFVQALRERIDKPADGITPAIDWGSYAGKRRHLPWFLLAARLLAQNGLPVLMHGTAGESADRLYTEQVFHTLNIPVAQSLDAACDLLADGGFAFVALESFAPELKRLLQLRELLGLRSPLHSVARMLNPLGAPLSVHGIFHRGFELIHQRSAVLLDDPGVLVFKGEGGEAEINPEMDSELFISQAADCAQIAWPPLLERRQVKPERLVPAHLQAVWQGEANDIYGEAAIISTMAAVLHALGRADSPQSAVQMAQAWWLHRCV